MNTMPDYWYNRYLNALATNYKFTDHSTLGLQFTTS